MVNLPRLLRELSFARIVTTPKEDVDSRESPLRRAILAGLLDAGVRQQPVGCLWGRREPWGPLEVLVAGVVSPEPTTESDPPALLFPLGATGSPTGSDEVLSMLEAFSSWVPCAGSAEELLDEDPHAGGIQGLRWSSSPFDDIVGYLAHRAFAWLVICQPQEDVEVAGELDRLRRDVFRLGQSGDRSEADKVERQRLQGRFRELSRAGPGGVWDVHVLVGAIGQAQVSPLASILCSAAERSMSGYRLRPRETPGSLDSVLTSAGTSADGGFSYPFTATAELLAALVRPPESELPGVRVVSPPDFDTTVEPFRTEGLRVELGKVMDRHLRPVSRFDVSLDTLNRHTFVCGATGGGKSQTIRGLLEGLSRLQPPVPWLVVEPAKAEYARMAGRVSDLSGAKVVVIRPGDVDSPPGSLNPLEPASLKPGDPERTYPLQSHADLVRALFLAAFQAEEPFPQVLSRALTECYERAGWDLVTGEPLLAWDHQTGQPLVAESSDRLFPRYPVLRDLQVTAQEVVGEIGYDEDIKKRVRGFVDVRIGSLRMGTPGRFFEGGHPLDFAALLQRNVVFEIESVTNDQDKAFVMGAVLIRLYEQLLLEERERFTREGGPAPFRHATVIEEAHRLLRNVVTESPAAHALELFASLLAEVRAYGEGIIIAEQIPCKLIPDAIKNTALKIVHRLPAADDRSAVGATMNLSAEQSEYVVTLEPGVAAVFSDGMDRPVLAQIPLGEENEDSRLAVRQPPLRDRRSRACAGECREGMPCTLRQIRHAERFLDRFPELTLWMEMCCAAHLLGQPAPGFVQTHSIEELRTAAAADPRLLRCAVAHAVERAIGSRYEGLKEFFDPAALGGHLAVAAMHAITPEEELDSCQSDEGRWRAGRQRFADIEVLLTKLAEDGDSPSEQVMRRARDRGLELRGVTVRAQRAHLLSLPWKRYPGERQHRLLIGNAATPLFQSAVEVIMGPGEMAELLAEASNRVFTWKKSTHIETLVRHILREKSTETAGSASGD